MIIYFLILFLLCCAGLRFKRGGFYDDFLSKGQSVPIIGLCVLVVFFQHMNHLGLMPMGYQFDGWGDARYHWAIRLIRQLLVVPFIFYSGFGVSEQIKAKGEEYVLRMPRHRIFSLWLQYAVAVCFYAIINIVFQTEVPVRRMVVSLTCLRSIGNPTWYIFGILCCYSFSFAVGLIALKFRISRALQVCLHFALSSFYILLVRDHCPHTGWWNTILVYPLGVLISLYKDEFGIFARRYYWLALFVVGVAFLALYNLPFDPFLMCHNFMSMAFMVFVVLLTMKIRMDNAILRWYGRHIFPFYMYHMFVILICQWTLPHDLKPAGAHAFVIGTFAASTVIAGVYGWVLERVFRKRATEPIAGLVK